VEAKREGLKPFQVTSKGTLCEEVAVKNMIRKCAKFEEDPLYSTFALRDGRGRE
jgi:hypothetical protein